MRSSKRSIIFKIPKEELQSIIDASSSKSEILRKLGINEFTGNRKTLESRFSIESFDFSAFEMNKKKFEEERLKKLARNCIVSDESIFRQNSSYSNGLGIKRRLLKLGVSYKCVECGNDGVHNSRPLALQLDHINGVHNDNRLENLRFLCPNCHSQTHTFSGKNKF